MTEIWLYKMNRQRVYPLDEKELNEIIEDINPKKFNISIHKDGCSKKTLIKKSSHKQIDDTDGDNLLSYRDMSCIQIDKIGTNDIKDTLNGNKFYIFFNKLDESEKSFNQMLREIIIN